MTNNIEPLVAETVTEKANSEQENAEGLSSDVLARRRMLLKSLGKGSALIAATVPLQSLATSSALLTRNGLRCSVSGMQSSVHSKQPTSSVICGGYSPGWWGQEEKNSKPPSPSRPWPSGYATMLCTDKFTKSSLDTNQPQHGATYTRKTLFQVMSDSNFKSTETRHWIGAFLNGFYQSSNDFPYSGQEILDFYNLVSPRTQANKDALYRLITTYLETHAP